MAEYAYLGEQEVAPGGVVLFNETISRGSNYIYHRPDSGSVLLSGRSCQCRALYDAEFHANIAIPTGGTAGAITLALALDGEPLQITEMEVTPAAVGEFFNVSAKTRVTVPNVINSVSLSVENTSAQAITVDNANLIIGKIA